MALEHIVSYDDLTQAWKAIAAGTYSAPRQASAVAVTRSCWTEMAGWTGSTVEAMHERIDHGFTVPGLKLGAGHYSAPRVRMRHHEDEGELQFDRALAGDDRPFLRREKRQRRPGLRLNIELNCRANVPASTIAAYAEWNARLIQGLQDRGFDLTVDVTSRAKQVSAKGQQVDATIRVKSAGRTSSLKSWGALFGPGAFRHLIFTARILACEANGVACSESMGGSFTPNWGLDFDEKSRTLTVRCAASKPDFPTEEMDAKLAALKF